MSLLQSLDRLYEEQCRSQGAVNAQRNVASTSTAVRKDRRTYLSSSPSMQAPVSKKRYNGKDVGDASIVDLMSSDDEMANGSAPGRNRQAVNAAVSANTNARNAIRAGQDSMSSEDEDAGGDHDVDDQDGQNHDSQDEHELSSNEEEAAVKEASAVPFNQVPKHIADQLYNVVYNNEELYQKILLFEPIKLERFQDLVKTANVKGIKSKEILRNWLDAQSICFYSGELTGQRYRY